MSEPISKEAAEAALASLRWTADSDIVNHEGEHVWLKPCYNDEGVRVGITDCCLVAEPCDKHRDLKPSRGN